MNKKGFMFVETIVMCAILMVALLLIYNSYTSAIAREKERQFYDTIEGQYKLINIKQSLGEDWKCNLASQCIMASDFLGTNDYVDFSSRLIGNIQSLYRIEKIYLTKCNISNEILGEATGASDDFKIYLKRMKNCEVNENYRLVAEFLESNGSYSYAWVEYPVIPKEA